MVWRGNTSPVDRALASLPYLLPLTVLATPLADPLVSVLPPLLYLQQILQPILQLTSGYLGMAIFLGLFVGVVRNPRVSHFIRFNAMQALLLDIGVFLVFLLFRLPLGFLLSTLGTTTCLAVLAASVYAWIQNTRGVYPEIPFFSEAAYAQVRF
jgi:uncharacterized membrane protein